MNTNLDNLSIGAFAKAAGIGVETIRFYQRKAIVTYDDSKTSLAGLTKATADAGYPSTPVR
jgi:mercuric ion binding protein